MCRGRSGDGDRIGGDFCYNTRPMKRIVMMIALFGAAVARANDDPETAMRLEKAVDRYLIRPNGLYYLNLDRTWRVGATTHRIISLAESNGSRFRDLRWHFPRPPCPVSADVL